MPKHSHSNALWFLIGAQLLIYGVIIEVTGLWEIAHPPAKKLALASTHPAIWWGALLLALGVFYVIRFYPRRSAKSDAATSAPGSS
ncbi:MAG: hypothetical protein M0Z50_14895 [Planctomycetia bacterium]|jgi:FtsH-binding integral membrane protein|nr:hypothetical protein [Planctomycetia bacterium]